MKRTIAIRLLPSESDAASLREMQIAYADACNMVSSIGAKAGVINRVRLHHLAYYSVRRAMPNLGSQMVCNAVAAASRALEGRARRAAYMPPPTFRTGGAVHLDARTYRITPDRILSVFTIGGRVKLPMRFGAFQDQYFRRGTIREAELCSRSRRWYLNLVLELPDVPKHGGGSLLGVDLGENVLAATSSGSLYRGGLLKYRRDCFSALRTRLQRNGSQSAKQLLLRISGRESRHVKHVNHEISASIVREALAGGYATIVMEDLRNIRDRMRMRKRVRSRLHRWAWRQLQAFIEYKAQGAGLRVEYVNPAYTSRMCSSCGSLGKRKKHCFRCEVCGVFAHSDRNAARNLAKIGVGNLTPTGDVMLPNVTSRRGIIR